MEGGSERDLYPNTSNLKLCSKPTPASWFGIVDQRDEGQFLQSPVSPPDVSEGNLLEERKGLMKKLSDDPSERPVSYQG